MVRPVSLRRVPIMLDPCHRPVTCLGESLAQPANTRAEVDNAGTPVNPLGEQPAPAGAEGDEHAGAALRVLAPADLPPMVDEVDVQPRADARRHQGVVALVLDLAVSRVDELEPR